MMILWFLSGIVIVAVVSTWAWRFQMRAMKVAGLRLAHLAGKPGTLVDVELTAVIADRHPGDRPSVLLAFRPAGLAGHPASALPASSTLVLDLPDDEHVALARLQRWQTSAAPVLLWRNPKGAQVELSQMQTRLSVQLQVRESTVVEPSRINSVNTSDGDVKNVSNN
jgi:hypothetical protein